MDLKKHGMPKQVVGWKRIERALLVYLGVVSAISIIIISLCLIAAKFHRDLPHWFRICTSVPKHLSMVPWGLTELFNLHIRGEMLIILFGVVASFSYFLLPLFLYLIFRKDKGVYIFLTFAFLCIYLVIFYAFYRYYALLD
jgi:hypothetical protein